MGGKRVELGEPSMFLVKDGGALDYHDDSEDGEREAGAEECEPEKNLEAEKARCILS